MKNPNEKNTFDTTALRARILTRYESIEDFSREANVKPEKLEGKEEFVLQDITRIVNALGLDREETRKFFFPDTEPEGKKATMANLLDMQTIIKRLENIEDGIIALDLMATGQIRNIGDTVTNEDFQNGFRFIMEGIMEQLTDLRANLNRQYARRLTIIEQ